MDYPQLMPFVRAQSPYWQNLLRQSVRLYLALGEPGISTGEAEATLAMVEGQMVWHLLQGQQELSPLTAAEAWDIVSTAQHRLLASPLELAECLRQLSASQSLLLVQMPGATAWLTPPVEADTLGGGRVA